MEKMYNRTYHMLVCSGYSSGIAQALIEEAVLSKRNQRALVAVIRHKRKLVQTELWVARRRSGIDEHYG